MCIIDKKNEQKERNKKGRIYRMKEAKRLAGFSLKILGEHCLEDIPKTLGSDRNHILAVAAYHLH